ncbi:MAG: hypothetical protein GX874_09680 [Smithella sp.]|nr:hypothetical protein [Smithella sp.]
MIRKGCTVACTKRQQGLVLWIIGVGLLFPLFFQLSGRIYNSVHPVIDSGGIIKQLPLPISLLACYGGLLLLADRYRQAALAIKVVAAMVLVMVLSLVLAGPEIEPRKVVLIIQVLLPMGGLVLGQLIEDKSKVIPKAFLGVLILIVPAQLIVGWLRGNIGLTHDLHFFSIYQHFQFVPLVFVCSYAYSISNLWTEYKKVFYLLTPFMYVYSVASLSLLTMFFLISFISAYSFFQLKRYRKIYAIILAVVMIGGIQGYYSIMKNFIMTGQSADNMMTWQYEGKFERINQGKTPANVEDRKGDWKLYYNGIVESGKTLILGHPAPFPREVKTSAHNWYLDTAYNFGLISLLPVILLLIYTLNLLWQGRAEWPPGTLWLAAIVLYLVVVDSNFKVTLRQPYPGIFTFFMWGMLLSNLRRINPKRQS